MPCVSMLATPRQDAPPSRAQRWLKHAIEAYQQGMMLDLNAYYCSGNLPSLLRERGEDGDDAGVGSARGLAGFRVGLGARGVDPLE